MILSTIIGSLMALFALLALIGFVRFWCGKPALNEWVTKAAKPVMIRLIILLVLTLLMEGVLFKDMPPISDYFK